MTISQGKLVEAWESALKAAKENKKPFDETGRMCSHFFTGSVGFMWDNKFRAKYLSGIPTPKFQITIAKAFELVSIVGPTLMWNNPGRIVRGYERLEFPAEFWMADEQMQQMGMMWAQEYAQRTSEANARNSLMQHYLNYSHREQPGGGLKTDSQMAIIDALVKGRGCIRLDTYDPPGNTGTLTGGFYVPVDKVFIDPHCTRANLSNARWIAVEHNQQYWEVERKFGWPAGSLRKHANKMSQDAAQRNKSSSITEKTTDIVTWYEIFSRCGAGTRFHSMSSSPLHDAFEESVGDNCYLCVVPGMKEFLNCKTSFLETATTDQVQAAMDWPIPFYMDNRWPIAFLDFWHQPDSAWPLAPLAMGLGELIFLNVFISSLADRIYQDGLSKAAIRQDVAAEAVEKLISFEHEVLELNPSVAGNINELVSFLQRPNVNFDAFRMIEYVSSMFDKRVGLMELLYGLNPGGKVSRTAADANIKGEAVSTRPEWMASQVESWQTEIANLERIAAGYAVAGQTLEPLLGSIGSMLWDTLITQADPSVYMREMQARIEANSIRKPNKARDNENMQQISGYMIPMLQWYTGQTGNTEPLNAFLKAAGRAIDQDVDGWLLPPIQPPQPSPEEMAAQQEAMEMEKARKMADIQKRNMDNARTAHKMLEEGQGLPLEAAQYAEPLPPDDDMMPPEGEMMPPEQPMME